MEKILSIIVAVLVAVSFATIVFAVDVPTSKPADAVQVAETDKVEVEVVARHDRHHWHHRHHRHHRHYWNHRHRHHRHYED